MNMRHMNRMSFKVLVTVLAVPYLITNIGKSNHLNCEVLERNYVICQRGRLHFYGLWSDPIQTFRLRGAEVEELEHTDSEGDTYYTYNLYLNSHKSPIEFHNYGGDNKKALIDKKYIVKMLNASSNHLYFSLNRSNVLSDIYSIFGVIVLSYFIKIHRRFY